jgi:hypothetical protein
MKNKSSKILSILFFKALGWDIYYKDDIAPSIQECYF